MSSSHRSCATPSRPRVRGCGSWTASSFCRRSSDVFLGTARNDGRDYYVRQFRDMKGTIDTDRDVAEAAFGEYVSACAVLLAGRTPRSANASMLHGYVGGGATVRSASRRLVLRLRREITRRLPPTARCGQGR